VAWTVHSLCHVNHLLANCLTPVMSAMAVVLQRWSLQQICRIQFTELRTD